MLFLLGKGGSVMIERESREEETTQSMRPSSQSVDWYHEGESRTVEVNGVQVTVRLIGRKGRRSRIAIVAPAGAAFREHQSKQGSSDT
jgi:hypothetical protein